MCKQISATCRKAERPGNAIWKASISQLRQKENYYWSSQ